jgi:glycosyltransferase involved in cell wall biosynthesis
LKPKVAVIGAAGLPAKYGGFETFVHFLTVHLASEFDLTVYCSGPDYRERPKTFLGARLSYLPFRANGIQSLLFDMLGILHACFFSDVFLVLGATGGFLYPFARLVGKTVVLNPDGLDWQRSKWGPFTRRFLRFLERSSVRQADILVCDNEGIGEYLRRVYGRESHLIEYGGDQVSKPPLTEAFRHRYPFVNHPYAFSVARIQRDNNIEMILDGFSQTPEHALVFVGNWASSAFGRATKQKYGKFPNIHLLDAIYDPNILNSFRGYCDVYLHGHSAGGTNPSLVEAMCLGLPIASFDVIYNRATTEGKAFYFRNAEELASLIRTTPDTAWERQRTIMMEIGERRYRWSTIAAKYAMIFRGIGH